jgi:hypothetical protein
MRLFLFKNILALIIKVSNFINFRKPKILFYTDSRGYNILSKSGKNPLHSYIKFFLTQYQIDYFICPQKHTTIPDFLLKYEELKARDYDFVVMHCGVVDFSPRPISNLRWVLESKSGNKYFRMSGQEYSGYYESPSAVLYNKEKTINLYSSDFLQEIILPDLLKIRNLIWINSNFVVPGWEGNYEKGRPKNINQFLRAFDLIMKKNLTHTVDLKSWDHNQIMRFTLDNIHFNKIGFQEVSKLLKQKIAELNVKNG